MGGNFLNTSYNDAINNISEIAQDLLNNPYYMHTDKKATSTTYYHINDEKSTMDESAIIPYDNLGLDCPFRYNRIFNFFIYGLNKVELALEVNDVGLESGEITGDGIILPNTIIPYPGDFFEISYVKDSTWLFQINDVNRDTLSDGANIWKITYRLVYTDNSKILDLVVEDFNMVINNQGTKFNPIIKSTKYELIKYIDDLCIELKEFYKNLFYNTKIQSFSFSNVYDSYFYDAFMVEFLSKNKILENSGSREYIVVDHKLPISQTFTLDYERTFFRSLETKKISSLKKVTNKSTADIIDNKMSIFSSRLEEYFNINYKVYTYEANNIIECISDEIILNILENKLFEEDEKKLYNIIIKYFNDTELTKNDIDVVSDIEYKDSVELFYIIPAIIFCLEKYIINNMS